MVFVGFVGLLCFCLLLPVVWFAVLGGGAPGFLLLGAASALCAHDHTLPSHSVGKRRAPAALRKAADASGWRTPTGHPLNPGNTPPLAPLLPSPPLSLMS